MGRKRVSIFFLLLAAFAVSFLLLFSDIVVRPGPLRIYHISMIARGKNASGWASIREGATLAADENNAELSFILLGEDNDAAEQMALLRRESEAGVDAILLSAADSQALGGALASLNLKTPVICVESPAGGEQPYVSGDNYGMGIRLGRQLANDGLPVRMAVVAGGNCRHIVQRQAGLMHVLNDAGISPAVWELPEKDDEVPAYLLQKLSQRDADVVVALDFLSLEHTAQMVDETGRSSRPAVYGIGGTDKILSYLEQGTIASIVVQNDFAMGYLAVQSAVAAIEGHPAEKNIFVEHRLVSGRTMYDSENQPLLFPFIR